MSIPGPPTNLGATGGDGTLHVIWSPPVDNGGIALHQAKVVVTPGTHVVITEGDEVDATLAGLESRTDYRISVNVRNAVGDSAPAELDFHMP